MTPIVRSCGLQNAVFRVTARNWERSYAFLVASHGSTEAEDKVREYRPDMIDVKARQITYLRPDVVEESNEFLGN